jgi:IS30 family transposase
MKKHQKLTAQERDLIAVWKSAGTSLRQIATRLDRSPSTISRELKRNRWGKTYVAIHAQAVTEKRIKLARKRHSLKNRSVYKYVLKKLRKGWSPEQISGRLKLRKPNNPYWHICHETIYSFIYHPSNSQKKLWEYLPRKQKRRRKQSGRSAHRCRIPDRVSIHNRPSEVETRETFGHWEGDSVEGKGHRNGVHTEVERKSRYYMARIIKDLTADQTAKAQSKMFRSLPNSVLKSTTVDNGREFTKHRQFKLPVFFADPYSSWQRGSNEYHNGLLRRYLPKGTDFSKISQKELDEIVEEINNRPRKCLGFRTPKEVFMKELGVAIQNGM